MLTSPPSRLEVSLEAMLDPSDPRRRTRDCCDGVSSFSPCAFDRGDRLVLLSARGDDASGPARDDDDDDDDGICCRG